MEALFKQIDIKPALFETAFLVNMIMIILLSLSLNIWMLFIVASWANRCDDEEQEENEIKGLSEI